MAISRILPADTAGSVTDGPRVDANLDQIIGVLNTATDVTIPALTTLLANKVAQWVFPWYLDSTPATPKERYITGAATNQLVVKLKAVFTGGSASGTTTFELKKVSGGGTTSIGTLSFTGSGDAVAVTKSVTFGSPVSLSENDQLTLTVNATGSQRDFTVEVTGTQGLT